MAKKKLRPENDPEKGHRALREYARYSNLAFKLIAVILAAFFFGFKLDQWLSLSFPVFALILSTAGMAGVLILLIRDLNQKK